MKLNIKDKDDINLITDEDIIKLCFKLKDNKHILNRNFNRILKNRPNYMKYVLNRFNDTTSIIENICRIFYNIDNVPKCKICGKQLKFNSFNKPYNTYCSRYCMCKDKDIVKKRQKTFIKHFGVDSNFKTKENRQLINSDEVNRKRQQTYLDRYGVKYNFHSAEIQRKSHSAKANLKREQTCLRRYGVKNIFCSKEEHLLTHTYEANLKRYLTFKKNNSFNTSKPEDESYVLLKEKYPDTQKQYKSELYPFNCDFYIPSLDLYIECNYHWTHGFHPYDPNNIEDKNKLKLWKSKSTKFYDNAIKTWTIRDINKRNIVKENKLNWIEFFDIKELKKWLK